METTTLTSTLSTFEQSALALNEAIDADLLRILSALPHHVILATVIANLDNMDTEAGALYNTSLFGEFDETYTPLRELAVYALAAETGWMPMPVVPAPEPSSIEDYEANEVDHAEAEAEQVRIARASAEEAAIERMNRENREAEGAGR